MKIAVFAKKRNTADGKKFYTFLSTLSRKDGTELTVSVKFPEDATPKPDDCPMYIDFDRKSANLAKKTFVREDTGEMCESYTLWVKRWTLAGEYIDKSLDDFV